MIWLFLVAVAVHIVSAAVLLVRWWADWSRIRDDEWLQLAEQDRRRWN